MGLNSGMLDDILPDDLSLTEGVELPGQEPTVQVTEVVVQPENISNQTLVPEDKLQATLDLLDKEIFLEEIVDDVAHVEELKDIEARIISNRRIDKVEADAIDLAFEGFIGTEFHRDEFTSTPSRVNLQRSLDFMGTRIGLEEEKVLDKYKESLETQPKHILDILGYLSDNCIEELKDSLYRLHGRVEAGNYNLNDFILPCGQDFVKLHQVGLDTEDKKYKELVNTQVNELSSIQTQYVDTLENLTQILHKSKGLALFIATYNTETGPVQLLQADHYEKPTVTLENLLAVLSSEGIKECLDQMAEFLQEELSELTTLFSQLPPTEDGFKALSEHLNTQGHVLIDKHKVFMRASGILLGLTLIIAPMNTMLDYIE